ncbi:MAG: PTS sugar transporter subunit IIB [Lachnospiraceae bacterium]|nr:PTS sugar transporter subunit IIB [Lachnospiraceae bacterium]MBQ2579544.1 PTS sugar transporter subunit IIB [Lachnospiraceae bacterium]MBQ4372747.1 PTS sugar transporter subunit IIB [Lachnospiraceae bacterium]MBQ5385838.1 PTS sugar transporter subunit IIB [Lachnospiraceae bacterium]
MRNIALMCSQGMSTSMMVQRMQEAAATEGYECTIEAYSVSEVDEVKKVADVILLGPQVRFQLKKLQDKCDGIPMDVIDQMDYGMMNGQKVLAQAKKLLGE